MKIKYLTEATAPASVPRKYTQFSPEYQWNEKECVLEIVGEKDDQEYIQSFADVSLDKVFDKFCQRKPSRLLVFLVLSLPTILLTALSVTRTT